MARRALFHRLGLNHAAAGRCRAILVLARRDEPHRESDADHARLLGAHRPDVVERHALQAAAIEDAGQGRRADTGQGIAQIGCEDGHSISPSVFLADEVSGSRSLSHLRHAIIAG